jgi:GT2 family glycosyltransferase
MTNKFDISVCICTRNRPDNLRKTLNSLEKSTHPIYETIVSDDSTNTDTEILIPSEYPRVKYVPGPRRGLGANRNNALKEVTGSHVLFLDDDAVLDEHFLETALADLEAYAGEKGDELNKIIITGPQMDHGRLMFPGDQDFLGFQKIPYKEGEALKTVVINSAIFPTNIFQQVLFDEKLIYGCDEVDFTTRAIKKGFKIKFCSEAINLHLPSLENRDFYKPYHEASRLYVTFKRYFSTENNGLKALLYLVVAGGHTLAHTMKIEGLRGISKAIQTFRLVSSYLSLEYFPARK